MLYLTPVERFKSMFATFGKSLLLLIGAAIAADLWFVSAASNVRFGYSQGSTELDHVISALAYVAADGAKAIIPIMVPIFSFSVWRNKEMSARLAQALTLWIVCVMFSLSASVGFSSTTRSDRVASRSAVTEVGKEISSLRSKIESFQGETPGWYDAQISKVMLDPKADNCQTINGPYTKEWCPKVAEWQAQKSKSQDIEIAKDRLKELSGQITTASAVVIADPQAEWLSNVARISIESAEWYFTALQAALYEFGSALGFFVLFGNVSRSEAKTSKSDSETRTEKQIAELTKDETKALTVITKMIRENGGGKVSLTHRKLASKLQWNDSRAYKMINVLTEKGLIIKWKDGNKTSISLPSN